MIKYLTSLPLDWNERMPNRRPFPSFLWAGLAFRSWSGPLWPRAHSFRWWRWCRPRMILIPMELEWRPTVVLECIWPARRSWQHCAISNSMTQCHEFPKNAGLEPPKSNRKLTEIFRLSHKTITYHILISIDRETFRFSIKNDKLRPWFASGFCLLSHRERRQQCRSIHFFATLNLSFKQFSIIFKLISEF